MIGKLANPRLEVVDPTAAELREVARLQVRTWPDGAPRFSCNRWDIWACEYWGYHHPDDRRSLRHPPQLVKVAARLRLRQDSRGGRFVFCDHGIWLSDGFNTPFATKLLDFARDHRVIRADCPCRGSYEPVRIL